jgi:hypothetical protein
MGIFTWFSGGWIIKNTKRIEDIKWAGDMAAMLQVSMIGYAVSGAFLGLGYFDLYYHLVAIMILLKVIVLKHVRETESATARAVGQRKEQFPITQSSH